MNNFNLSWPIMAIFFIVTSAPSRSQTLEDTLLIGTNGWSTSPKFTVGEMVTNWRPPGKMDGIGAKRVGNQLHVYVNHELDQAMGSTYTLQNGVQLKGARITKFVVNASSRNIISAGLAYERIYGRTGALVTSATEINESTSTTSGIDKLCSASLFKAGTYNLVDDMFITGEEADNGQAFVLDIANNDLYCAPWLGRAKYENVAFLQHPNTSKTACLIGDDTPGAPLYLYIGDKNYFNNNSFLDRNGLAHGTLYVMVAGNGISSPQNINGTGTRFTATFQPISHFDPAFANTSGYDALGFAHQVTQYQKGNAIGNFHFSRPEDIATDPYDGTRAVMASTGRGELYPADDWGTTYIFDVEFSNLTVDVHILYDGDDAGGGQFTHADHGLRSPDNLEWARSGSIYVQEDRSTYLNSYGSVSGQETSIWEIDPLNNEMSRIAKVDRAATLPYQQYDDAPATIGFWETSGILDVTDLFDAQNKVIMLVAVQAHSLLGGAIFQYSLVEGGQLLFMEGPEQTDLSVSMRAKLDGPYVVSSGLMRDDLRSAGLLPINQPFGTAPDLYNGNETIHPNVLSRTGSNAIVDWVMLEARSSASPSTIVKRRAALIQRDGDIVDMDGISPVRFRDLVAGNYYVSLKHRTHLGVMPQDPQPLNPIPLQLDLSLPTTTLFGTNAMKNAGSVRLLWAGDANHDGMIKYTGADNDRDPILSRIGGTVPTAIVTGYYPEDLDQNGIVRYTGLDNDRDRILQAIGGTVPTQVQIQQLP